MSHYRFRYTRQTVHIYVRVFIGKAPELTHGKSGELVFSPDEWAEFEEILRRGAMGKQVEVIDETPDKEG